MTRNRSNSNHIAMKGSLFSFPPVKLLVVYVVVLCAIGIQQQTARIVAATTPAALSFSTIEKEVDNYYGFQKFQFATIVVQKNHSLQELKCKMIEICKNCCL